MRANAASSSGKSHSADLAFVYERNCANMAPVTSCMCRGVAYLLELVTVGATIVTGWVQLGCDEAVPLLYPPLAPSSVAPHG